MSAPNQLPPAVAYVGLGILGVLFVVGVGIIGLGILGVLFVVGVAFVDLGTLDYSAALQALAAIVQALATVVLVIVTGFYAYTVRGQLSRMLRDERREQALQGLRDAVLPTADMVADWDYNMVDDVIDPDSFRDADEPNLNWRHVDRIVVPGQTPIDVRKRVEFQTNPQIEDIVNLLETYNETIRAVENSVVDSYGRLYLNWAAQIQYDDSSTADTPQPMWGQQWATDIDRAASFVHGDDPVLETGIWDTVLEYYLDDAEREEELDGRYAHFLTNVIKARYSDDPTGLQQRTEQQWNTLVREASSQGHSYYREVDSELDEIVASIRQLNRITTRLEQTLLRTILDLVSEYNIRADEFDDPEQFRELLERTIQR